MTGEIKNSVSPLLTIGIPTFNRAKALKNLLLELSKETSQEADRVEVYVSDNASTDETSKVLQKYSKNKNIRFTTNQKNLGFDGNVNNIFKQAKGRYVWVLGDDDSIAKGCVKKITAILEKYQEVSSICLNYNVRLIEENVTKDPKLTITKELIQNPYNVITNDEITVCDHNMYFVHAKLSNTFLSSNIFRRDRWDFSKASELIGSGFIHVLMIPSIISGKKSLIIKEELVEQVSSENILSKHDLSYFESQEEGQVEAERTFDHPQINSSIKYPSGFWVFEINIRLKTLMVSELNVNGFSTKAIDTINKLTVIEALRQSIYLKRSNINYSFSKLAKLIYLSYLEYKKEAIFWLLILPILILPRFIVKIIANVIFKIFGKKARLGNIFNN